MDKGTIANLREEELYMDVEKLTENRYDVRSTKYGHSEYC